MTRRAPVPLNAPTLLALVLAVAFGALSGETTAQEVEEILDYDVTVDVRDGGRMTVREEIRVRALGHQIRRGIFRDIPTSFPRRLGFGRIEAPFEVVSITRDGRVEPYEVETVGGPRGRSGMRIRIGSPDVLLDPGVHEYAIGYETSRWVEFGEDVDRLYWNVTGNGWSFPIRSATARVRIDGVTSPPDLEAWAGPEGSTESNVGIRWDADDRAAVFETTRELLPGEGLTIRATFPKGRLAPPGEAQREEWTRLDWGGWIDAGYVVLLVVAVYLLMWRRVGIDPPRGSTGVSDRPPEGYSPAALGYIDERGYDQSLLSAALVSMALKGAIRIEQDDDTWVVRERAAPEELDEPLAPEELALHGELLGSKKSIRFTRSNHDKLRAAIRAFRSSLSNRLERDYFEHNRVWFAAGLGVSLIGFAALAWRWRFDIDPVALFLGLWLTVWSAGVATLAYRLLVGFRLAWGGGGAAAWAAVGFLSLFSLPFFVAEVVVIGLLFTVVPFHIVAAGIAIGFTNVLFYHLLERPTLKGRGVLDGLDAFRAHLESAADHRQRAHLAVPDASARLEVFERFLPFAIALGIEQRWTEAFGDVLAAAVGPDLPVGTFEWYRSSTEGVVDPTKLASDLGAGLSSRLSAMSSPPSSGSSGGGGGGFSGGGSSGGGGGGGGGGGW